MNPQAHRNRASNRRTTRTAPLLVGLILLNACAGTGPTRTTTEPSTGITEPETRPSGPLRNLDDLVAAVRHRNPGLIALRQRARRLSNIPAQAAALPDPKIMTAAGEMAETAAGRIDAMTSASQKIPFPGKRRQSAAAARREAEAAARDVAAMELQLEQQTRAAWWDLWLAHKTGNLQADARSMLSSLRETVDARIVADRGRQADQIRLSNEISAIDKSLLEAERLIATSRARLNQLLNRPSTSPLPTPPEEAPPARLVQPLDHWLSRASRQHPQTDAAELRRRAYDHRRERARLEAFPDLEIGLTHAAVSDRGLAPMATGEDQFYVTLGFNLPLWSEPRRAMLREAEAGQRETAALADAARSDLVFRITEAHADATATAGVLTLFEEQLLPDSRQAHELTVSSYAAAETNFSEVIETWQQQLRYQLQHATARTRLGKAQAALRSAANTPSSPSS